MSLNEQKIRSGQKDFRYWVMLFLKGMAMGGAEVVPGVSGGTIAFITGIYERLLGAISAISPKLFGVLHNSGFGAVWKQVDGTFLLVLLAGMATSIFSVARLISQALTSHPVLIWSFFFGLILASIYLVSREIKTWSVFSVGSALTGALIGAILTQLVPASLEPTPIIVFLGGAVAVCAWILPGLSGSFILLLLGLYATVISAIITLDFYLLGSLALGCTLGLISFSHLLIWMLNNYRDETMGFLAGLMIGALSKIWPWKHTLSYQLGENGEQIPLLEEIVLPGTYQEITGAEPQLAIALLIALVGLVLVIGLERITRD